MGINVPGGTAGVHQKQSEQKVVPVNFLLDVSGHLKTEDITH